MIPEDIREEILTRMRRAIKPAPHQRGDVVPALSDVFRTGLQQAWS